MVVSLDCVDEAAQAASLLGRKNTARKSAVVSLRRYVFLIVQCGASLAEATTGDPSAPCSKKLKVREEVEPLDAGGDTHKQPIPAQVCRTLKVELCTESAIIGAAKN